MESRKKRGPYKRYVNPQHDAEIPTRSKAYYDRVDDVSSDSDSCCLESTSTPESAARQSSNILSSEQNESGSYSDDARPSPSRARCEGANSMLSEGNSSSSDDVTSRPSERAGTEESDVTVSEWSASSSSSSDGDLSSPSKRARCEESDAMFPELPRQSCERRQNKPVSVPISHCTKNAYVELREEQNLGEETNLDPESEGVLNFEEEEEENLTVCEYLVGEDLVNNNEIESVNPLPDGAEDIPPEEEPLRVINPAVLPPSHDMLHELLTQEQFTSTTTTPVNASPAEALLMVLAMGQENNLTFKALVDSVKLVNALFTSPIIANSAYMLDKILLSTNGVKNFFFCEKCSFLFGSHDHTTTEVLHCPECDFINKITDLTKTTYFALFPLAPQIELLFMNKDIREQLVDPKEIVQQSDRNGVMKDLYDAKCYKEFVLSLPDNYSEKIISFVFCTDGSPLFKSSTFSIWPFFLTINELPPVLRMGNVMLGGLWFGNKKPHMDLFLQPIAEHIRSLSVDGFTIKVDEELVTFKAYALGCCVDSGARGAVQGLNCHSGYYSCPWCEIPGEYLHENTKVIFPFSEIPPKPRTHESVVQYATECVADERLQYVYGVLYLSPLAHMPKFDIVSGMVQDFPHNVPFGISRTFLEEWTSNTARGYYIGSPEDTEQLDKKMLQIKPPIEVRRPVRKVSDSPHWNAREYENWTLIYSIVVLTGILPLKFLNHWSYLVQAIFLLSRQSVSEIDVNNAHMLLLHFVSGVEMLYGPKYMTFNVHILGHLAENAARWGPIWAVSTYCFESGIKDMKSLLHAQRGVAHQIHRAFSYKQAVHILRTTCRTNKTDSFEANIVSKPNKMTKYLPVKECVLLGKSSNFDATDEEGFLLDTSGFTIDVPNCSVYKKIIYKRCVYTTDDLSYGRRFNNSVALTTSDQIIVIKKFLLDRTSEQVFLFCVDGIRDTFLRMPQGIQIAPEDHCVSHISSMGRQLKLKAVRDLKSVCVKIEMNGKVYVSPITNLNNVF